MCAADPARKSECVQVLNTIRSACNAKADDAQARMQELGSVDSKQAKPEMEGYTDALNMLFAISREAQQLSYKDPKALELLKGVNRDTGEQQYRMNRTFEIVEKIKADASAIKTASKDKPAAPSPAGGDKTVPHAAATGGTPTARTSPGRNGSTGSPSRDASEDEAAPKAADEAAAQQARTNGGKAMSRARGLGDALKRGVNDEDVTGTENASGRPGGAGPAAAPKTEKDLLLASVSGFGGSLTALGLQAGKDASGSPAILRADGSRATVEDLAALKARIANEPAALMRRPNFFSVIPRKHFQELKEDFRSRPELRNGHFRHIALSESERDFQRSASCSTLSGPCAPHAAATSYKKGDEVPPEELAAIHRAVHDEPEGEFFDEGPDAGLEPETHAVTAGSPAEVNAPLPTNGLRAVIARLESLIETAPDADRSAPPAAAGASASGRRAAVSVPGAVATIITARLKRGLPMAVAALLALALLLMLRRRAS